MRKELDLNHQYKLYLERVGLSESAMHPQQRIETKQAFFGACGQMLILLRDDLGALEYSKAIDTLQDMLNQVSNFWLSQQQKQN